MTSIWLLIIGAAMTSAWPLLGRKARSADVLSPSVLVGLLVIAFVVARAVLIVLSEYQGILGFEASPLEQRRVALMQALSAVIVGMAMFHLGYALSGRFSMPPLPVPNERWQHVPFQAVAFGFLVVGFFSALYLFATIGSPAFLLKHQYMVNNLLEGHGYTYWGTQFLILAFIFAYAYHGRPTLLVLLTGVVALSVFLIIGRRWNLLTMAIPVAIIYSNRRRAFTRKQLVLATMAGVLFFNVAFVLRFTGLEVSRLRDLPVYLSRLGVSGIVEALVNQGSEYKLLDVLMVTMRDYPEPLPYEYGRSLMHVALTPIPRRWLPEKPVSYASTLAERLVPGRTAGLPAMSFGRFQMDGGWCLIAVGMLLLGAVSRVADRYREQHASNKGVLILYSLFVLFLLDFVRVADYPRSVVALLRLLGPATFAVLLISGPPFRRRNQSLIVPQS